MTALIEDAKYLSAIVESITLAVSAEPIREGRVVDLLALIPEILCAEPFAQRVVYLLSACDPCALLVRLVHPSLQSAPVSLAAMRALVAVLTRCAAPLLPPAAAAESWRPGELAGRPGELAEQAGRPGELAEQAGRPGELAKQPGRPGELAEQAGRPGELAEQPGRPGELAEQAGRPGELAEPAGRPGELAEQAGRPGELAELAGRPGELAEQAGRPGELAELTVALAEQLQCAAAVPAALDALLFPAAGPDAMSAATVPQAAALLFALVAHVGAMASVLCAMTDALFRIAETLLRDAFPPAAAEYTAGVLRICADIDATRLPVFIVRDGIAQLVNQNPAPRRARVLLAECIALIAAAQRRVVFLEMNETDEVNIVALVAEAQRRGVGASLRTALCFILRALLRHGNSSGRSSISIISSTNNNMSNNVTICCATTVARAACRGYVWTRRGIPIVLTIVCYLPRSNVMFDDWTAAVARAIPPLADMAHADITDAALAVAIALARSPAARRVAKEYARRDAAVAGEEMRIFAAALARAAVAPFVEILLGGTVERPPVDTADPYVWAEQSLSAQEAKEGESKREIKDEEESAVREERGSDALMESCTRALLVLACERSLNVLLDHRCDSDPGNAKSKQQPRGRFSLCYLGESKKKEILCGRPTLYLSSNNFAAEETVRLFFPMRFGLYFSRTTPRCYTRQTWTMREVRKNENYVLFIPFHELTTARVEEEKCKLERLAQDLSRGLVTTPTAQRCRRSFLADMVHNILPLTRMLLCELADILQRRGHATVVEHLGWIRQIDAHTRSSAKTKLDVSHEITIVSQTVFKDVVHSANVVYCISRLRQRFNGEV